MPTTHQPDTTYSSRNTKTMPQPTYGYFPITSVHRDDLEGLGYDTSNVDDGTMLVELASKMAMPA
jgi:hypothetical protein